MYTENSMTIGDKRDFCKKYYIKSLENNTEKYAIIDIVINVK